MNNDKGTSPLGDLTKEARYYDYASTANPLFAGLIPPVP